MNISFMITYILLCSVYHIILSNTYILRALEYLPSTVNVIRHYKPVFKVILFNVFNLLTKGN